MILREPQRKRDVWSVKSRDEAIFAMFRSVIIIMVRYRKTCKPNSRRHSPYTENPYKGTLSFTLTYCIQIELFYNATFYTLEDGVLKEIECIFYEIEGIFDGFGQPGR